MNEFDPIDTAPVPVGRHRGLGQSPTRAYLVVLQGKSLGKMYPVRQRVVIGRGDDVDVHIDDNGISRHHAAIEYRSDRSFFVRDLGSRNGTKINGEKVDQGQLQYGDRIDLGAETCLKFVYQDELEIQLQESQRLETIGRLAGGVAHEFNNVLTVILNNLSFMLSTLEKRRTEDDAEMLQCVVDSLTEVRRGAQLTRNLLGFAKRGQFEPKRIDLHDFILKFARLISRTVERNIRVHSNIDKNLFAFGDASQLHQVLLNLGLNARDAMPSGGNLHIIAKKFELTGDEVARTKINVPPGSYIQITVSDTGAGMDEETRRRIFEPFFSTKDGGKGTGLGLAVAYGIVQSHNGHLIVRSTPGKGSEFHVLLPSLPAQEEGVHLHAESITRVVASGEGTILLVDDEEGVRRSVERLLTMMGYDVISAADGEAALSTYEEHREDVQAVLLDLTMPKLDGEATYHRLREINPKVKVILCSGHVDDERVTRLQAAGISGLLLKPFERGALARIIGNVLAVQNP